MKYKNRFSGLVATLVSVDPMNGTKKLKLTSGQIAIYDNWCFEPQIGVWIAQNQDELNKQQA